MIPLKCLASTKSKIVSTNGKSTLKILNLPCTF